MVEVVTETFDPRPFVPKLTAAASLRVVLRVFRPPLPARVDLAGKTVIPTLTNAHTHVGFQRGAT